MTTLPPEMEVIIGAMKQGIYTITILDICIPLSQSLVFFLSLNSLHVVCYRVGKLMRDFIPFKGCLDLQRDPLVGAHPVQLYNYGHCCLKCGWVAQPVLCHLFIDVIHSR